MRNYMLILKLAAESPEVLRAIDVYRVMSTAYDKHCMNEFKEWLLAQELNPRTRATVEAFTENDI